MDSELRGRWQAINDRLRESYDRGDYFTGFHILKVTQDVGLGCCFCQLETMARGRVVSDVVSQFARSTMDLATRFAAATGAVM